MASARDELPVNSYATAQLEDGRLKSRLIDAAETCFERKGVAHTSMLDIAGEAGVSRTTLYKHYPRIDDVLQAAFLREFDRFEDRIVRSVERATTPQERLLTVLLGLAENVPRSTWISSLVSGPKTKTDEKALTVGRGALDARVRKLIDAPLTELAEQRLLRDDVDRDLVIDWLRVTVQAFSVVRHPGQRSTARNRTLIERFVLRSVLR